MVHVQNIVLLCAQRLTEKLHGCIRVVINVNVDSVVCEFDYTPDLFYATPYQNARVQPEIRISCLCL